MRFAFLAAFLVAGCAAAPTVVTPPAAPGAPTAAQDTCREGDPLTVRFYDAGQALAALVELPDGRRILIDAGESPRRPGCKVCAEWHERVVSGLRRDIHNGVIDLLWVTHQHSDHMGGVPEIFAAFRVLNYVDNGLDLDKATVRKAREAAEMHGVVVHVVNPDNRRVPLDDTDRVKLRAIVPDAWPSSCKKTANDCSIGLRIDYCRSSLLFVGDAEEKLEASLDVDGPVTLLQVGHHGSDSSTTEQFIAKVKPGYAVVASAKPNEGTNRQYCHPRKAVVERLTRATGGPSSKKVTAFDGAVKCKPENEHAWSEVPTSERMWFTARDGEVVLETRGDGEMRWVAR